MTGSTCGSRKGGVSQGAHAGVRSRAYTQKLLDTCLLFQSEKDEAARSAGGCCCGLPPVSLSIGLGVVSGPVRPLQRSAHLPGARGLSRDWSHAFRMPDVALQNHERWPAMSSVGTTRKVLFFSGIALLGLSAVLLVSVLFKLIPMAAIDMVGHAGLRGIGGIAVFGCLLAAIGSNDD